MVSHVGLHYFTETVYGVLGIHRLKNKLSKVLQLALDIYYIVVHVFD